MVVADGVVGFSTLNGVGFSTLNGVGFSTSNGVVFLTLDGVDFSALIRSPSHIHVRRTSEQNSYTTSAPPPTMLPTPGVVEH